MSDVSLAYTVYKDMADSLIQLQQTLLEKQIVEINQLRQQVDMLVDSVNWYEKETRHNETFEKLRDELEHVKLENIELCNEVQLLEGQIRELLRGMK